jgi:hypothetical protein
VYDFYGNLLRMNTLEDTQALEITPRFPKNMLIVLKRDGVVTAMQFVLRFCR